jgi:ABC-type lipoprotein export system ATPase subunit
MATPALHIDKLSFRYRATTRASSAPALCVPRLELHPGEQLLLTGGSGSGKSTLLHLIAGLLDPDAGRISLAGRDIHGVRGAARDQLRGKHIGMIFQTFNLLHGFTACENVMAALMFSDVPSRKHRLLAIEVLGLLGIKEIDRAPAELSVGQQQRVAVARAMVTSPSLVLADEPTASLDPQTGMTAIALIQELCQRRGAALLCVSHDPALWPLFSRRQSMHELVGSDQDGAPQAPVTSIPPGPTSSTGSTGSTGSDRIRELLETDVSGSVRSGGGA